MNVVLSLFIDTDLSQTIDSFTVAVKDGTFFLEIQLFTAHDDWPGIFEEPDGNDHDDGCWNQEIHVDLADIDKSYDNDAWSLECINQAKDHSIVNNSKIS